MGDRDGSFGVGFRPLSDYVASQSPTAYGSRSISSKHIRNPALDERPYAAEKARPARGRERTHIASAVPFWDVDGPERRTHPRRALTSGSNLLYARGARRRA